jgi:chromosome segregation ATPase
MSDLKEVYETLKYIGNQTNRLVEIMDSIAPSFNGNVRRNELLESIAVSLETLAAKDATQTTQYVELSNQTVAAKQELKARDAQIEMLSARLDKAAVKFAALDNRLKSIEGGVESGPEVPEVSG